MKPFCFCLFVCFFFCFCFFCVCVCGFFCFVFFLSWDIVCIFEENLCFLHTRPKTTETTRFYFVTVPHPLMLNALASRRMRMSKDVSSGSTDIFLYSGCSIPSHFCNETSKVIRTKRTPFTGPKVQTQLLSPQVLSSLEHQHVYMWHMENLNTLEVWE